MRRKIDFALGVLILMLLFGACAALRGQTIAFPTTPVGGQPGNPSNPVKVMKSPFVAGTSGYAAGRPVPQCQWGPCAANPTNNATWQDVIGCSECAGGTGGRYPAKACDSHQGVSIVFGSSSGWIVTDNYLATTACLLGPGALLTLQVYDARNWPPVFVGGNGLSAQKLAGFKGADAYFVGGSPCNVVHMDTSPNMFFAAPCLTSYDPLPTQDSAGRTWIKNDLPNGIKVASGPTPTAVPTVPSPTSTPLSPTPTQSATGLATATPTRTSPFPTVTPSGCPCPVYVLVTATPGPR